MTSLEGLNLMSGLTSLNISGTQVSDLSPILNMRALETLNASNTQLATLTAGMLPESLVNIDLSGNTKLTTIEKDAFASLKNVETLDLSDNTALQTAYLNGMEAVSYTHLYHANARGAGEGKDFNTVAFDIQYAQDDGQPLLDGDTQASRDRVNAMTFTTADSIEMCIRDRSGSAHR